MRLQCPRASRLAQLRWERPKGSLHLDTFLQLDNGSLSFLATPLTMGTYQCVAVENGYEETLDVISVKQRASPRSFNTRRTPQQRRPKTTIRPRKEEVTNKWSETRREEVTQVWAETGRKEETDAWAEIPTPPVSEATTVQEELGIVILAEDATSTPINENPSTWRESRTLIQFQKPLPSSDAKSYYSEMLVVSLLFVVSLCMLMVSAAYIYHQRSSVKGYTSTGEEAVGTMECDPLSKDKPPSSLLK